MRLPRRRGVPMNCSVALQYLPMNVGSDDEVCRIVDEVIAVIDALSRDRKSVV